MDNINNIQKEFLGSGWSFPVTFSVENHQLQLTKYETNINEMIHLILQTTLGERPFSPQFGSGLQTFFFKEMRPTLQGEIREAVKTALLNNEPRIKVLAVEVTFSDIQNGLVEVTINYMYNQTNTRHNYVYPFFIKEGTNLQR
ncbi:GPW/gp25 family protein [Kordia algicida OT-1]|uniref:Tail lysozyme, putative n=1 Tax=Kordia algicida OT-1 TaxID=391587 RepID=A9DNH3_9FLAO|nr:GPW/gp25 family protein [Kordia algicida]EDP97191.1 tail lysozyme, putative [Kordia algicida OT-1]